MLALTPPAVPSSRPKSNEAILERIVSYAESLFGSTETLFDSSQSGFDSSK
jgi:hypothetical protein